MLSALLIDDSFTIFYRLPYNFIAACTSTAHHQVSRSCLFGPLVMSQTFFAASIMLFFNVPRAISSGPASRVCTFVGSF